MTPLRSGSSIGSRSLRDLIGIVDDFQRRGIQFRSLTEEINTGTPGGKLTFHIFGALAEFERSLIIERTRAAVSAARERGVRFGRKPKLTTQKIAQARKLIAAGERTEDVAAAFHVGRTMLYRALATAYDREATHPPLVTNPVPSMQASLFLDSRYVTRYGSQW